jgi:hypothetical protein
MVKIARSLFVSSIVSLLVESSTVWSDAVRNKSGVLRPEHSVSRNSNVKTECAYR